MTDDIERGFYGKYRIERTDGRTQPGEKHENCLYFVLDLDHDPLALEPLKVYAESAWNAGYHELARDLWGMLKDRGFVFGQPSLEGGDPVPWEDEKP